MLTKQIFEGGAVVSHEIIDDRPPGLDASDVRLEETCLHQHVERLSLPRTPSVLITAQTAEHLRAGTIARQIVYAAHTRA